MIIIKEKWLGPTESDGANVLLRVDRFKLLKRRWRGKADDGEDFGFELDQPLSHGDTVYCKTNGKTMSCYVIEQEPETVLEIDFSDNLLMGLHVAWSIGNLHMPMQSLSDGVRVADDPAVRQLFAHLDVRFVETSAVFQPIRSSTDIGHSHDHSHDHAHGHDHSH